MQTESDRTGPTPADRTRPGPAHRTPAGDAAADHPSTGLGSADRTPAGPRSPDRDPGASLHHDAPLTRDRLEEAARVFRLLADPTRLAVVAVLTRGPADVTTLAEAGGASRTSTSQHLAKLRLAGLVSTSRDGRHVRYALRGGHLSRLVAEALNHADHEVSGEPHHG